MLKLLQDISRKTLLLNESDFTEEQKRTGWLGVSPATEQEIQTASNSLQVELPADYIELLKITNGFSACTVTGVTFLPISKVDYLINVDEDLVALWNDGGDLKEIGQALSDSLLVGGLHEEQYFLLIPPNNTIKSWRYWMFANWLPGEHEFKSLKDYFKSELAHLKSQTKGLKKPKPKPVIDYSLLDQVFNLDWPQVYKTAFRFLCEDLSNSYYRGPLDLLRLLLLSAAKCNCPEKLVTDLRTFKATVKEQEWLATLVNRFEEAAIAGLSHIADFQMDNFVLQENGLTFDEIEEQTMLYRPDLLKPKKKQAKADYQLYFFFTNGNAEEFVRLYEVHLDSPYFNSHYKAAIVYTCLGQPANAQIALEKYWALTFNYSPLEPFLHTMLLDVMTEDFTRRMNLQFKQIMVNPS